MSDMSVVQQFVSTTLVELLFKILAAIVFWVVGRWLISKVVALMQAAMGRNHVDTTLKDTLTAHGFRYQPEGTSLVFSINADPTGRRESSLSLGVNDQTSAQVHIAIDTYDSGQSTDTVARGYRITLGVYERDSGRYVWRAEINDLSPDADPFSVTKPMVEKLVAALEKSVQPAN